MELLKKSNGSLPRTEKEVNEYVKNTYETQKKWRKLLDTQENY